MKLKTIAIIDDDIFIGDMLEEVLPHIRNLPVIVVSAKIGVDDKVNLLINGAADYITKPFDTKELLARITVQLRKQVSAEPESVLSAGNLTLDLTTHKASGNGAVLHLTRTEFAILRLLMQNPGQVIAKSVMLDRISEDTPDCTESSLKVHISNLRQKLREDQRAGLH